MFCFKDKLSALQLDTIRSPLGTTRHGMCRDRHDRRSQKFSHFTSFTAIYPLFFCKLANVAKYAFLAWFFWLKNCSCSNFWQIPWLETAWTTIGHHLEQLSVLSNALCTLGPCGYYLVTYCGEYTSARWVGSIRRCWIPEVSTWFCISNTSQPQNECHFCYGLLILTRYNTLNVCYLSQENAIPFTMMLLDISGSCLVSFIFKGEQKVKEITWEPTLTFKERMAKLFEITPSQDSSVTLERTLTSGTTSWRQGQIWLGLFLNRTRWKTLEQMQRKSRAWLLRIMTMCKVIIIRIQLVIEAIIDRYLY